MKNIVKVMLQEGIDEETIHEVLNIISEVSTGYVKNVATAVEPQRKAKLDDAIERGNEQEAKGISVKRNVALALSRQLPDSNVNIKDWQKQKSKELPKLEKKSDKSLKALGDYTYNTGRESSDLKSTAIKDYANYKETEDALKFGNKK